MSILVGIDGTGEAVVPGADRDAAYDAAFANSFVKRMCNANPNSRYYRGPVALGGGLVDAINGAVQFVQLKRRTMPNEHVVLTGYSRGAAGAVVVAKELKKLNIPVRALMLFDCVDRHGFVDASIVPNNVGHVCHVIRNPAARSRMTFGNDAMQYIPPTVYPQATMFLCTHGGMGGMPWAIPAGKTGSDFIDEGTLEALMSPTRMEPVWTYRTNVTYSQDERVSREVWQFVQPFLRTHGF